MKLQVFKNLNNVTDLKNNLDWQPYTLGGRVGAQICRLYGGNNSEDSSAAFVRYLPGAMAKPHRHQGYETIQVLEGSYIDETGEYSAGMQVTYPPGSIHSVVSEEGAVMFIVWEKPTVTI